MPTTDEWSGLADLLANLIEKYASDLGLDNMSAPCTERNKMTVKDENNSLRNSVVERDTIR